MPKANNFGSIGNTYKHGKASHLIAIEVRNRNKNLTVEDVKFVGDKFVFSIRGKKFMTVTAKGSIKKKIVAKVCAPMPNPEIPNI